MTYEPWHMEGEKKLPTTNNLQILGSQKSNVTILVWFQAQKLQSAHSPGVKSASFSSCSSIKRPFNVFSSLPVFRALDSKDHSLSKLTAD